MTLVSSLQWLLMESLKPLDIFGVLRNWLAMGCHEVKSKTFGNKESNKPGQVDHF